MLINAYTSSIVDVLRLFSGMHFQTSEEYKTQFAFNVESFGFNTIVVALQSLHKSHISILKIESVLGLCHSFLHLFNLFKTISFMVFLRFRNNYDAQVTGIDYRMSFDALLC